MHKPDQSSPMREEGAVFTRTLNKQITAGLDADQAADVAMAAGNPVCETVLPCPATTLM